MQLQLHHIKPYMLAGKATVIVKSRIASYAFVVKRKDTVFFISYKGQETEYIGYLKVVHGVLYFTFKPKAECRLTLDSPPIKAFFFMVNGINQNNLGFIEVWHDGNCGKCGRQLTDPESIESGLGPICAGRNR